jgi:hypothetical protein
MCHWCIALYVCVLFVRSEGKIHLLIPIGRLVEEEDDFFFNNAG